MTENLRDRLESVEETQTLTIFMRFKDYGWARFNIDNKLGSLAIQSDWGSWQHVWGGGPSSWGSPTFVDFLKDRDACHYLTDKLHYGGRTRSVVDGKATAANFGKKIIADRRELKIDEYEARSLWRQADDFVREINGRPYGDNVWALLNSYDREFHQFFPDAHEMIETEPAPSLVFLRDQLLPTLIAYLRGEIDGQGHPTKQTTVAV